MLENVRSIRELQCGLWWICWKHSFLTFQLTDITHDICVQLSLTIWCIC